MENGAIVADAWCNHCLSKMTEERRKKERKNWQLIDLSAPPQVKSTQCSPSVTWKPGSRIENVTLKQYQIDWRRHIKNIIFYSLTFTTSFFKLFGGVPNISTRKKKSSSFLFKPASMMESWWGRYSGMVSPLSAFHYWLINLIIGRLPSKNRVQHKDASLMLHIQIQA